MELKDYLKSYRQMHGVSQRRFAEICGLSNGYISMLERGYNPKTLEPITCSIGTLQKLASGMGITLETLLIDVDDMPVELLPAESGADDASSVFKKSLSEILPVLSGFEGVPEAEAEYRYMCDIAESNRSLSLKEMADIADRLGESLSSMLGISAHEERMPTPVSEDGREVEVKRLFDALSEEGKASALNYLRYLAANADSQ